MRKKLTFLSLILLLSLLVFSQIATKQAFIDFAEVIGNINRADSDIQHLHALIGKIEELKAEIIDDSARKAELIKILDIHPDYSVNWIQIRINKITALKAWLENNGYIH